MDKFYTTKECSTHCYDILLQHINIDSYDVVLEPSSGTGSFYNLLTKDKRLGLDIDPKCEGVIKQDFFTFVPNENTSYLVVGNPPFGRVSSMAIRFFNKASEFASVIAFILPKTFKRVSVQNRLDLNFLLIYSEDLPLNPCCFEPKMSAKCVFQIWKRSETPRHIIEYEDTHPDFSFVKLGEKDENNQPTPPVADFALKAYGSNCGEIIDKNMDKLRPKSWHWIISNISVEELKNRFLSLDYSISEDTVRQNSIGQKELILLYKNKFG
jgi:hypothetical protein